MKKFVLAPALAALAMFFWGFLFWGLPHDLPYKALSPLPDEAAAGDALQKIFPVSGTYLIPGPHHDEKQLAALFEKGPHATVSIMKEGHPMMEPIMMLKGYLHGFLVCLLLMIMLQRSALPGKGYGSRVRFCTAIGLAGSVFCRLGTAIWWYQSWGWHLVTSVYDVVAFLVAGLVLAAFTRSPVPVRPIPMT